MSRDEEIVEGICKKNQHAFAMLVEDYGALIRSIARFHLSGTMYAEECVNDVLLALWQNMPRYDADRNSLKNWIGAVAKYKCADYLRRHYRELRESELCTATAANEAEDLSELVEELLAALKPDDRRLFREHYLSGRSIAELAAAEGKPPGLLYNRLSLGRKRLRKLFKERTL